MTTLNKKQGLTVYKSEELYRKKKEKRELKCRSKKRK